MKFDVESTLGAVMRSVEETKRMGVNARAVKLSREYETGIDDLWDAVTSPDRLARWFAKVEGDLRPGGSYQIEGNASGEVIGCTPPEGFDLTWEFGTETSWVELRLLALSEACTQLELTHIAPVNDHWKTYGPGAVGVGWELGLLGLAWHLERDADKIDEAEFAASADGKAMIRGSAEGWGEAAKSMGQAAQEADAAARATAAFYTGEADS